VCRVCIIRRLLHFVASSLCVIPSQANQTREEQIHTQEQENNGTGADIQEDTRETTCLEFGSAFGSK